MFNKHYSIFNKTEYVPYEKSVKITENRAPTDESVRLLSEFEDKARLSIIRSALIETNEVKAIAIAYCREISFDMKVSLHVRFTLNGKEYISKYEINRRDFYDLYMGVSDEHFRFKITQDFIIENLSKVIAIELCKQLPEQAFSIATNNNILR